MAECRAAFYARVSSEAQARDKTIASQVAALRERIAADGVTMLPDAAYIDEGHSGSSLVRPALERLRDAVAAGDIDRVYVLAPDRLARRHAHQALLMEEFRRAGIEVAFLNRPIGASPEDDLLLQIQGVIAEYERAQILERGRRGRRHAARIWFSQRPRRRTLRVSLHHPRARRWGCSASRSCPRRRALSA